MAFRGPCPQGSSASKEPRPCRIYLGPSRWVGATSFETESLGFQPRRLDGRRGRFQQHFLVPVTGSSAGNGCDSGGCLLGRLGGRCTSFQRWEARRRGGGPLEGGAL